MSKNLFITAMEPMSGKSAIALGVMELLIRNIKSVAFFRPITSVTTQQNKKDATIDLISEYYNLGIPSEEMYAFTLDQAKALVGEGKHAVLLEGILDKYKALENKYDFVLCLGTDYEGSSTAFEFDINAAIANNLGCPIMIVTNGHDKTMREIEESCQFALETFEDKKCNVLSLIVNRTPNALQEKLVSTLKPKLKKKVAHIYSLPYEPILGCITMSEIASILGAEVLFGVKQLNRLASRFTIAAMHLKNFLPRLVEGSLIITPVDRLDVILGTLAALRSQTMPNIAGIVLTGYLKTDYVLFNLLEGMSDIVPILKVADDTFTTAMKISELHSRIQADDPRKIAMALGLFETNVDTTELRKKIVDFSVSFITPKMFEFGLIKRARARKQHIVLPEGEEDRVLEATEILMHRDVAEITLLGNKEVILQKISSLGLDIKQPNIIEPLKSKLFEGYVETYYKLRKHKGITRDNAFDVMSSVNHFGTMMVYKDHADGMVSGSVHSTRNTVRPAFEFIKTKQGSSRMSSVFFMCLEDRVLVYGDCAVNPNPTSEQLAEIAVKSAETAAIFGIKPVVAMLSYSTGTSGVGLDVDKVRKAVEIAQKMDSELPLEGPIQYDAAVDIAVARTKMPDSKVAGKATVFIFPDLNTGNNTYKAVQRSANAVAIGPVMQGLNKPVNDLSRGCTVVDIVNTVAITAIQAQADKGLL
ncbi:MAG: phosphate acetyltransferase [Deltaproteobacteria bacterium]|nr:phosphate acetyltransferase [Deltaproteobacteria bacterium]